MKLMINGQDVDGITSATITQLLDEQKVKNALYVTVEHNGEILERDQFDSTTLKDGDKIEFLYFMGGGQWN